MYNGTQTEMKRGSMEYTMTECPQEKSDIIDQVDELLENIVI